MSLKKPKWVSKNAADCLRWGGTFCLRTAATTIIARFGVSRAATARACRIQNLLASSREWHHIDAGQGVVRAKVFYPRAVTSEHLMLAAKARTFAEIEKKYWTEKCA